jgi:hypothetical protein
MCKPKIIDLQSIYDITKKCSLLYEYLMEYAVFAKETPDPDLCKEYGSIYTTRLAVGILYLKYGIIPNE